MEGKFDFQPESRKEVLMGKLKSFFNNPEVLEIAVPIIQGRSHLSLRELDWLAANWSKKNPVIYETEDSVFNLNQSYKNQLKAYSKKYFDPFKRREREMFQIEPEVWTKLSDQTRELCPGGSFETTAGQLCFFRWAIQNGVIRFAYNNLKDLSEDMKDSLTHRYGKKEDPGRRKRKVLSKSATNSVFKDTRRYVFHFDN